MKITGRIDDDGKLILLDKELLTDWIIQHPGKNIEIEIKLKRKQRTLLQNAYYHGVVVAKVHEALRDLGHDVDEEETHELLKAKFNSMQIVNGDGVVEEIPRSTKGMDTIDMMVFIEKIQRWAAEYLGITIPNPNEQLKIDIKD